MKKLDILDSLQRRLNNIATHQEMFITNFSLLVLKKLQF